MKDNIIKIVIAIVAVLFLVLIYKGCSGDSSSPEYGSKEYLSGLSTKEYINYMDRVYAANYD